MIIKISSSKDTFITNLKTLYNDGSKSNFGSCSTLDLFKLYNENKNAVSKLFLEIQDVVVQNGTKLTLEDYKSSTTTLIFDNTTNVNDASLQDEEDNYIVGVQNGSLEYASQLGKTINSLKELGIIDISCEYYQNYLIMTQGMKGESGDTSLTFTNNFDQVFKSKTNVHKFARIEQSHILIKFDIENINGLLENINFENSVFNNLNAKLLLKDVSTGLQKPKNYTISAHKLLKNFDEGIGKDIKNLSDIDVANFYNLNQDEDLLISEFLIPDVDFEAVPLDEVTIVRGDENVSFDISDIIKQIIKGEIQNNGILIKLNDEFIYNNKTYFAKRFGSRHLLNKKYIPVVDISIQDEAYGLPIFQKNKNITNDIQEFYLYNNSGSNRLTDFFYPTTVEGDVYNIIRCKVKIENDENTFYDALTEDVYDFKGNVVTGVKKFVVPGTLFKTVEILNRLTNNQLTFTVQWYYSHDVLPLNDVDIKIDTHTLLKINDSLNDNEKEYVTLKFNRNLSANNSVYKGMAYFIDPTKRQEASRISLDIKSNEYPGDLYYKVLNAEDNSVLCDYSEGTRMFFDGEKYTFNFFIPDFFVNKQIYFEYKILVNNDASYITENYQKFRIDR